MSSFFLSESAIFYSVCNEVTAKHKHVQKSVNTEELVNINKALVY